MSPREYRCTSVTETQSFAADLANSLPAGIVIALIGNLGSGKTTFTQGFAKGLGISEHVGSPTFKLVSEYDGQKGKLIHVDAYRLEGIDDFLNIGGEDILATPKAIILIEWGDKLESILPPDAIRISFERVLDVENERLISIKGLKT
jgi:tRNA threonylcarbamoyladenosine biosynthesis protein TsaE